ncbi:MAG: hypothetical protein ACFBSC_00750 [Microcoleaceae cyanobacterium]
MVDGKAAPLPHLELQLKSCKQLKEVTVVLKRQNPLKTVQLADGIQVMTLLDETCIPALRSGFAEYPVNPRWNAVKFHAWKQGRQLRLALKRGEMWVRPSDSMLVASEVPNETFVQDISSQASNRVSPVKVLFNPATRQGELHLA